MNGEPWLVMAYSKEGRRVLSLAVTNNQPLVVERQSIFPLGSFSPGTYFYLDLEGRLHYLEPTPGSEGTRVQIIKVTDRLKYVVSQYSLDGRRLSIEDGAEFVLGVVDGENRVRVLLTEDLALNFEQSSAGGPSTLTKSEGSEVLKARKEEFLFVTGGRQSTILNPDFGPGGAISQENVPGQSILENRDRLELVNPFTIPIFELHKDGIEFLKQRNGYSPDVSRFESLIKITGFAGGVPNFEYEGEIFSQDLEDLNIIKGLFNQEIVQRVNEELLSLGLQDSQLYLSLGVSGNKMAFCLIAAHTNLRGRLIRDKAWGVNENGIEELILLPGEIERVVMPEDPEDVNYKILTEGGINVSLGQPVLMGIRKYQIWMVLMK